MHTSKRKKLESRGWKVGDTRDFLGLDATDEERIALRIKLADRHQPANTSALLQILGHGNRQIEAGKTKSARTVFKTIRERNRK